MIWSDDYGWFEKMVSFSPAISQKRRGFSTKTCWIRAQGITLVSVWAYDRLKNDRHIGLCPAIRRKNAVAKDYQQTNKPTTTEQADNQHFKRFIGRVTFSYLPGGTLPSQQLRSHQIYELPHKGYSGLKANVETTKAFFAGKKPESVDDSLGFHSRVYFAWCFAWCLWFPYCPTTGRKWKPEVDSRFLQFLFLILFIPLDA